MAINLFDVLDFLTTQAEQDHAWPFLRAAAKQLVPSTSVDLNLIIAEARNLTLTNLGRKQKEQAGGPQPEDVGIAYGLALGDRLRGAIRNASTPANLQPNGRAVTEAQIDQLMRDLSTAARNRWAAGGDTSGFSHPDSR